MYVCGTHAKDRAGLIAHEIFLAYLHEKNLNLRIDDIELNERVRLFNSDLFEDNISDIALMNSFNKYFEENVLSASEHKELATAEAKINTVIKSFCANQSYDVNAQLENSFSSYHKIYPQLSLDLQNRLAKAAGLAMDYQDFSKGKRTSKFILATIENDLRDLCSE